MRTIIDIPPDLLARLDSWASRANISRAEAVRRALATAMDAPRQPEDWNDIFGAWKIFGPQEVPKDGLIWQRQMRDDGDA
jgi:metal-responsive CopG/Arc/MetJ family transcriptional regulator